MSLWQGKQLALAMDATALGDRFVVLAISVVYRGCAIPVIWTILPANVAGVWRPEWLRMLRLIKPAIPKSMTVIVLADRGLYARWLFKRIVDLGWHPFLRINNSGKFRPEGKHDAHDFRSFVPQTGTAWSGKGTAFANTKNAGRRLNCTLLACWQEGYKDPWLILTDLPPEAANAGWYGLRSWIEQGFKITKRAGWQWQSTRMSDPARASRLWLAVSVATLWLLSVGGESDQTIAEATFLDLTSTLAADKRSRKQTQLRLVSVFRRGWTLILVALINHSQLPRSYFLPQPWPQSPIPNQQFLPHSVSKNEGGKSIAA
ncbi:MAG: transposase [Acidobacteriota bacterium]